MDSPAIRRIELVRAVLALGRANALYWPTVAPVVRRELGRWRERAALIPDPQLRGCALNKLADAGSHAEATTTLATLTPRRWRRRVVQAIVAYEVMYDYLDAVSERLAGDSIHNGLRLYRALPDVFAPTLDRRARSHLDDGGYLDELAEAARRTIRQLPSSPAVAPTARATAELCGHAQARAHAVPSHGTGQLRTWAEAHSLVPSLELHWWETAAGLAASVLAVHALIAAAGDPRTTSADAARIAEAYLAACVLTTMLDSLIDRDRDAGSQDHSFVAHYDNDQHLAARLEHIAQAATTATRSLPHAAHHRMTVAGIAAFYLSTKDAQDPRMRPLLKPALHQLRPLITPITLILSAWRNFGSEVTDQLRLRR